MKFLQLRENIKKIIYDVIQEQDEPSPETSPEPQPEETPAPVGTQSISADEAVKIIKDSKGKFFTVTFIKRTDGSTRVMNARLGVKVFLKGGELPFDPVAKRLLPVYDVQKHDYRMINLDSIKQLKIDNITYNVR